METVKIFKYQRMANKRTLERVFVDYGFFHEFGCNYEEFESGAGNFSTAIVEMKDGTIKNISVELIQFMRSGDDR